MFGLVVRKVPGKKRFIFSSMFMRVSTMLSNNEEALRGLRGAVGTGRSEQRRMIEGS